MGEEAQSRGLTATMEELVWAPQPGPQTAFLECPVPEIFFGGARGGGKSDALLGDWLQHEHAYRNRARGILFRRHEDELEELQARAIDLFTKAGAFYKISSSTWIFPSGATLKMRFLERDDQAGKYKGHQYNWMGIDEADNFPSSAPIDKLKACLRSAAGVPSRLCLTGNPGGPGHEWLKARFIVPASPMEPFYSEKDRCWRVFIPSRLEDNQILMQNDPGYADRLHGSGPAWLVKAWREGDWSGPPKGGMLDPAKLIKLQMSGFEIVKKFGLKVNFYLDLATKAKQREKDDPDFQCITVMGRDSLGRVHILYQWSGQVSMEKVAEQLILLRKIWKPQRIKGEKIGLQYAFRSVLKQTCRLKKVPYFWVEDMPIPGDKVFRAVAIEGLLNSGILCVPAEGSDGWLPLMESDWGLFPDGRYKDRIDAPAYGAIDLQEIQEGDPPKTIDGETTVDGELLDELERSMMKRYEKARAAAKGEDTGDDD